MDIGCYAVQFATSVFDGKDVIGVKSVGETDADGMVIIGYCKGVNKYDTVYSIIRRFHIIDVFNRIYTVVNPLLKKLAGFGLWICAGWESKKSNRPRTYQEIQFFKNFFAKKNLNLMTDFYKQVFPRIQQEHRISAFKRSQINKFTIRHRRIWILGPTFFDFGEQRVPPPFSRFQLHKGLLTSWFWHVFAQRMRFDQKLKKWTGGHFHQKSTGGWGVVNCN